MVILTIITPIISLLIEKKEGVLSPAMISGRGIRGVTNIRNQF